MHSNWWMFHGDPSHTGLVTGSSITSQNVQRLKLLHDVEVRGPIISVPAVVDGFLYVGLANHLGAKGGNGGQIRKIDTNSGRDACRPFEWDIDAAEGDSHGFMGMGCTPAVYEGRVYFSALNGKVYCLDKERLNLIWVTDLRHADVEHNQPVWNVGAAGDPPAAGWSSPVLANGSVYVGAGESENPALFGFIYSLDAATGCVNWIYCTCQFEDGVPNRPNVLPPLTIRGRPTEPFTLGPRDPVNRGCSIWSSIAYDAESNWIFCSTANPKPDRPLPTPGFSNGVLALDASTGEFRQFFQALPESSYRPTDQDVDFGGSPTLFRVGNQLRVAAGCKNGALFVLDGRTFELVRWRQLLPFHNDGTRIATVDTPTPSGENYTGTFSTPAIHAELGRIFIALGGPNYHVSHPGIDYSTTPFLRALDWESLEDVWDMDNHDPRRYKECQPPMYRTPGEAGLSSPAVVNDLVFVATSKVAMYGFNAKDGKLLWADNLGEQTGGDSGGFGYCVGPAISGDIVVAGGLVFGRGGFLKIYKLDGTHKRGINAQHVSFEKDIVPIFRQFRGSMIWRLDLTSYEHVKSNADAILIKIKKQLMPPTPFPPLTDEQVQLFSAWMSNDCPP